MKIAAITEDGITISQHFGRAPYYLVLTIENGEIVERELRDKLGHNQFSGNEHHDEHHAGAHHDAGHHDAGHHDAGHGLNSGSHDKHVRMAESIADCEAVLCRGMGMGAYQSMQILGIRPVVTDITTIEDAALAYSLGNLIDHTERLH
jgi:predicted Fe-Mo cluster-binding NifX family protein